MVPASSPMSSTAGAAGAATGAAAAGGADGAAEAAEEAACASRGGPIFYSCGELSLQFPYLVGQKVKRISVNIKNGLNNTI